MHLLTSVILHHVWLACQWLSAGHLLTSVILHHVWSVQVSAVYLLVTPVILHNVIHSSSFSSKWHCSAWKGPYALNPISQQSPKGCPRNSASICLVEHRSFSTLEGGVLTSSFLHSSFLQAINSVILWPVHVQKVLQASEYLCPAKLQNRYGICCACQSICPSHSH